MTKRKIFSKEFKLELGDKSPNNIAIDLGIRRNMLYKWQEQLKKHGNNAFKGPGRHPIDQNDEASRLKRKGSGLSLCKTFTINER